MALAKTISSLRASTRMIIIAIAMMDLRRRCKMMAPAFARTFQIAHRMLAILVAARTS
jgi:hypothetical protein